ncbi:MAG: AAA family ATPase, partial [Candidatus Methanomethylophilaceae archaeon]|nr:AAA family ATPase [Candidatus Methanomethylophilaceae archaeon]
MYLKQIELENFKSFGGKMTIPLMEGYLAVTGPNGSGKSNITDAILFVLGPKSSKAMRAGKLTDLIFDGGKTKNRADYTKVSLVFDNSDHILPWNDTTVRLTRLVRLAANGADYSSYFYINDQKSSMTEFDNLLSRARISADGYNLVQQGDVTRIVQMSSVERRRILDGISGIASYDADISKSEAERASAQTDLDRIDIIRTELERQLAELEKAMEDAKKYLDIQDRQRMAKAQMSYRGIDDENEKIASFETNINDITVELEKMAVEKEKIVAQMAECDRRIA